MIGKNPAHFDNDLQNPVEQVSWNDYAAFLEQANAELEPGFRLRLPAEAEWEYACRGHYSPGLRDGFIGLRLAGG